MLVQYSHNDKGGVLRCGDISQRPGYFTASGFYGLVDGRYMLFACEAEYYEYLENEGEDS